MEEQLLHYVWKHKIFPLRQLKTADGKALEVIHPGLHNTSNAGPDFFNAKVRIDGQLWVGNVEVHLRSSDWFRHHHDTDEAYANVILHVVSKADMQVPLPGTTDNWIPQLEMPVPESVMNNYTTLSQSDQTPRCRKVIATLPRLLVHSWMSALSVERLEERTQQVMERRERCNKDWEHTLFVTLARTFGFGINGDAFEAWARAVPLAAAAKHRDDLFQIEALFFGQAGFLAADSLREKATPEGREYYAKLQREYRYLCQKFSLKPMDSSLWRFLRLRPQNFPSIRIAQLAMLYHKEQINLSRLISADSIESFRQLLDTQVSPFWQTHYTFSSEESDPSERKLAISSRNLVILNTISPILFAYGRYKGDDSLCELAASLLEQIKAEDNNIVRHWSEAGIHCESAADSQALIQLTRRYCEPRNCLRCRFGYEYIRRTPDFLKEPEEETLSVQSE